MALKFSFKKLPVDADGKAYDTLEAFQAAQIQKLVAEMTLPMAEAIVANKAEIIEALEINFDSRPGARGVKKPRKPKADAAPVEPPATTEAPAA